MGGQVGRVGHAHMSYYARARVIPDHLVCPIDYPSMPLSISHSMPGFCWRDIGHKASHRRALCTCDHLCTPIRESLCDGPYCMGLQVSARARGARYTYTQCDRRRADGIETRRSVTTALCVRARPTRTRDAIARSSLRAVLHHRCGISAEGPE